MNETNNGIENSSIYEIGYLVVPSVSEEKVPEETDALRKVVTDAGAAMIAEEAPKRQRLAYEMRKKTVSGAYDKYREAYFGWFKFELGSDKIEGVKKAFEDRSASLRVLVVSTVRENTYLGKRASAVAAEFAGREETAAAERAAERVAEKASDKKSVTAEEPKKEAAPASIEEMDKSIDEMVKEAKI